VFQHYYFTIHILLDEVMMDFQMFGFIQTIVLSEDAVFSSIVESTNHVSSLV